ncbi:MAG TPA: CBS domain-containing protein [Kofleriaceae bacterium]|nr:CBS domain-containing protein [Kofleriaceae bacterium]
MGARHETAASTVHCPRQNASIPANQCLACCDCDGVDREGGAAYVRCSNPAAQHSALVDVMRQPLFASAADGTPVCAIMTTDVVCVSPDLGLGELAQLLLERNIGGAPVVDDHRRLVGLVSQSDLIGATRQDATVADIMMSMAFTLPESATVSCAAALMAFEGIHRVPILSSGGCVVGMLSSLDVARWLARHDGYLTP